MLKYLFPLSFFLFYIIFITLLIRAYRDRQGEFPSDKPYYLLDRYVVGWSLYWRSRFFGFSGGDESGAGTIL